MCSKVISEFEATYIAHASFLPLLVFLGFIVDALLLQQLLVPELASVDAMVIRGTRARDRCEE